MWFIRRKHDGKKVYLIAKEYTIGRRACSIDITDDATVSRKHCKFVIDKYQQYDQQPSFKVMDLESTFGVFVILPNSTSTSKLNPNEWVGVTNNCTIVFGLQNHWVVGWQDIPVLVSGNIQPERRKRLQILFQTLGSKACHDWHQDVMCLVMDQIAFTHKVLEILLAGKPITTLEFFEKWLQLLEENPESSPPTPSNYLPPLDSSLTTMFKEQDFLPNPLRKELFAGKAFLFPGEPNPTASTAIKNAGGLVVYGDHANQERTVIIDHDNQPQNSLSDFYISQEKLALSRGERLVPEREISLAILSASCQRYCNPTYNLAGRAELKTGRKKERQEPAVNINEEPPSKKQKCEAMEIYEPPMKKLKCTAQASTAKATSKSPPDTSYPAAAAMKGLIQTSKKGPSNPSSRSFINTRGRERGLQDTNSVRNSELRNGNAHAERSQITRSQLLRSSCIATSQKRFEKVIPKRVCCMRSVSFKDGKWK